MNLLLLNPDQLIEPDLALIEGRHLRHLHEVHRAQQNDNLKVGMINGLMGRGIIEQLTDEEARIRLSLDQPPPAQLPLTLLLALPRPKMLKRIFQTCATLGVADIYLINACRVEKSYWQSPWLQPEKVHEHFCLGLEQGVATQLPRLHLRKRFKPFVEDELPDLAAGRRALVAHPYHAAPCPPASIEPTLLSLGPEGGFIPYEVDKLSAAGLRAISPGPRIMRVETALTAFIAKLF